MNIKKRLVSALLAAFVMLSVISVSGLAATKETVKQYNSYLAIGSSITRGCGLYQYGYDEGNEYTMNVIHGNYPDILADAIGLHSDYMYENVDGTYMVTGQQDANFQKRTLCAIQGMTSTSFAALLGLVDASVDPFLTDEQYYFHNYYNEMQQYFGKGQLNDIFEKISTSELITIELGMGDMVYRAKEVAGLIDGDGNKDASIIKKLADFISAIYSGYNDVVEYYPLILDYIKENNPDATVVLVGAYNIVNGLTLLDASYAPIGDVLDLVPDLLNKLYKSLAEKYGYLYADITNVETPPLQGSGALLTDEFLDDTNLSVHPALNDGGLGYIARQIISVLPEETETENNKKDIVVDLGSVTSVEYVYVNGIPTGNYELNGSILTVHKLGIGVTLSITAKDENGRRTVRQYSLSYSQKSGYTAERVYGINDVSGKIFAVPNAIVNKLSGLFNRK